MSEAAFVPKKLNSLFRGYRSEAVPLQVKNGGVPSVVLCRENTDSGVMV